MEENRKIEQELFRMVYNWGRVGIVTDELCNTYQDKINELKSLWQKEAREEIIMWIENNTNDFHGAIDIENIVCSKDLLKFINSLNNK